MNFKGLKRKILIEVLPEVTFKYTTIDQHA